MREIHFPTIRKFNYIFLLSIIFAFFSNLIYCNNPVLEYTVSMSNPEEHYFNVEMKCSGWEKDTIELKMPVWMPGYYQIMNYAQYVENSSVSDAGKNQISIRKTKENTWQLIVKKESPFKITYKVKADKRFVANSFLDSTHAYIVPAATFFYISGKIDTPVRLKINLNDRQDQIATGLKQVEGKPNEFEAADFDLLYDSPVLIGDLEELPAFSINGIEHRFIGYKMGDFNRPAFMNNLKKVVQAGINIIGDIPYKQYTFIGIGPGRGGIEHLNNTTVSFDGKGLDNHEGMIRTLNFLGHEYFHNYNVKRIRPFELGPFDYSVENRTNLLWVSEGLSVYYEYLMVKRAGILTEKEFYSDLESNINATENNPGRLKQSLVQSSYNTWNDGPFGKPGETISYYDKGPLIGLILDLAIRNATKNKKSLDDVMRFVYWHYYKELSRGFTDAEFQQACEKIAGISLNAEFEYVNTTSEPDYNKYLSFAGLKMTESKNQENGKRKFSILKMENPNQMQNEILKSWLSE